MERKKTDQIKRNLRQIEEIDGVVVFLLYLRLNSITNGMLCANNSPFAVRLHSVYEPHNVGVVRFR